MYCSHLYILEKNKYNSINIESHILFNDHHVKSELQMRFRNTATMCSGLLSYCSDSQPVHQCGAL